MNSVEEGQGPRSGAPGRAMRAFSAAVAAFGFRDARQFGLELLVFAAILVAAGVWGAFQFSQFEFTRLCQGFDLWFDSDPARTVSNITSRYAIFHERSVLHPLYSLLIAGPFGALQTIFGLRTSDLIALYAATQSLCYSGAAYAAFRGAGLLRLDAVLGVLLLNSTAAVIYWVGFSEWIAFGAATVLISLAWVAAPASLRNRATGVAQNMLSGSVAVTNWVIGAAASFASDWPRLRWGQAFSHTRDALALMAALAVIQYYLFPTSGAFLNVWRDVGVFLYPYGAERTLVDYAVEFFGQTLVGPNLHVAVEGPMNMPGWGVLIITGQLQHIPVTVLTLTILALWAVLLALGARAALTGQIRSPIVVMVLGAIAYFFILHVAIGGELFLFSMHFAPLFVFAAVWALRTEWKWVARCLCAALIVLSFTHNYSGFREAVSAHNAVDATWLTRSDAPDTALNVQQTDCR